MASKPVSPEVAVAINRKKARYGRYVDTKQWDKYTAEVALSDAKYDFLDVNGKPLTVGRDPLKFEDTKSMTDFFAKFFAKMQTQHMFGSGDFTTTDKDDEVKAVFALEDQILTPPLGSWAEIRGGGFYYETWKWVDGDWFLKDLRMERTYQKMTFLVIFGMFVQKWLGISLL